MDAMLQQALLAAALRSRGDPRYGGSLPIGGKPYAAGRPEMFLTSYANEGADNAAYDHLMNMKESEMEDLSKRGGAPNGFFYSAKNAGRHELFGSALTEPEKRSSVNRHGLFGSALTEPEKKSLGR